MEHFKVHMHTLVYSCTQVVLCASEKKQYYSVFYTYIHITP